MTETAAEKRSYVKKSPQEKTQAELNKATAALDKAKARYERAEAEADKAETALTQAQADYDYKSQHPLLAG